MTLKVHKQLALISILMLTSEFGLGVSKPLEPFGYISVDCGGTGGEDPITGLHWETDEDYLQPAVRLKSEGLAVSSEVIFSNSTAKFRDNAKQLETARVMFLPQSESSVIPKYCFSFNVSFSNVQSKKYLVRAVFPNTNLPSVVGGSEYSGLFEFYVDAILISEIRLDKREAQTLEVFATAIDDNLDICFIPGDTNNDNTILIAISSLELRSLPETLYPNFDGGKLNEAGKMFHHTADFYVTVSRLNFGGDESSPPIRYPFDPYDRLWYGAPFEKSTWYQDGELVPVTADTGSVIKIKSNNSSAIVYNGPPRNDWFQVPPAVLTSAWEGAADNATIAFTLNMSHAQSVRGSSKSNLYCLSFAFLDVGAEKNNSGSRSVDINNTDLGAGSQWIVRDSKVPETGAYIWSDRTYEIDGSSSTFNIRPAAESTRPAMVNALELYEVIDTSRTVYLKVDFGDVSALRTLIRTLSGSSQIDSSGDPCWPKGWFWVSCTSHFLEISVSEINLSNQGLDGTWTDNLPLPPWSVSVFDLSNNSLHGVVPSLLGYLHLRKLDLSSNNFTGPIPNFNRRYSTPHVRELEFLNLSSNSMSGNLTIFSIDLPNLKTLDLSGNYFSGPIPKFGNTTPEVIILSSNRLSEGISDLLSGSGLLQSLKILRLEYNNLSGTVPDDIWSSESRLETVDLYSNSFTEVNLTSWCQSLVRGSINGKQEVNLLNNPITNVIFGNHAISKLKSQKDADVVDILKRSKGYILLGENEWCNRSHLPHARVLKRYLCRRTVNDERYSDLPDASSKRAVIISVSVSGSVFLVIVSILLLFLGRMWKRVKDLRQLQEELLKEDVRPPFYKYEDLRAATNNFSNENELGRGGFGAVYKAELADRSTLAVKLLFPTEQSLTDFLKETVVITGIKHRHLIQLKGCCVRDKKRMLIYEFAANGNLAQALWGNAGSFSLTWEQRFKICVGVAKGLSYLHEELQPRVIHRDIKPPNILLDKEWNAKIADFGLARTMQGDETQATTLGGTVGYVSPEYSTQGLITEKLDVYSYGILLLEIVSGRKCIDPSAPADEFYIRNWAFKLHGEGCLSKVAEKTLIDSAPAQEIESVLKIALSCVQEVHEKRPSMSEVVIMLAGHSSVAIDIIDELRAQQQVSAEEEQVLLALTSSSHTNNGPEKSITNTR
ncbi:hypothetical protein R1sor_003584 [Riccia sorocarpa]|uniref:non-specific serine/threonine protein kinase n=1 Tax=Riccia sorocarpa TaxID=122646 RepID=A0ABD3H206_9MARC